jgi:hypothetical protein
MIKQPGRLLVISGMLLGTTLATPRAAGAQAKFELTPFLGSFYPLAKICTNCNANNDGTNYQGRMVNSAAVGGRLTYWVSSTIGIEGSFGFTPSRIEERQDSAGFGVAFSAAGHILLPSGRLLFRPARTNLHFIIGGGVVIRGGDFWKNRKDFSKLTSPAGILGLGVRASVTPKFVLIVSAEGSFYSFDPMLGAHAPPNPAPFDQPNGSKLQADLLVSVGVPITLSR